PTPSRPLSSHGSAARPVVPPFPTRRSSDLLNPTPGAFLAAGQKANLSLTVLPLQDLQNVKVTVSDLTDKTSGAKIAADSVKIEQDRKSTRLNSSHVKISYAVFCLKKKKRKN